MATVHKRLTGPSKSANSDSVPSAPVRHAAATTALADRTMGAPSAYLHSPRVRSPRRGRSSPQAHAGRAAGSVYTGDAPDRAPLFHEQRPSRIDPAWETVLDPWAYREAKARSPGQCCRTASGRHSPSPRRGSSYRARPVGHCWHVEPLHFACEDKLFSELDTAGTGLLSLAQVQVAVERLHKGGFQQLDSKYDWFTQRVRERFNAISKFRRNRDSSDATNGVRCVNRTEFRRLMEVVSRIPHDIPRPRTPPHANRGKKVGGDNSQTALRRIRSPTRSSANKRRSASPRATRPAQRDQWVSHAHPTNAHSSHPALPMCAHDRRQTRTAFKAVTTVDRMPSKQLDQEVAASMTVHGEHRCSSSLVKTFVGSSSSSESGDSFRTTVCESSTVEDSNGIYLAQATTQEHATAATDRDMDVAEPTVASASTANGRDIPAVAPFMSCSSPPVELGPPVQRFPLRTSILSRDRWLQSYYERQFRHQHQYREQDTGTEIKESGGNRSRLPLLSLPSTWRRGVVVVLIASAALIAGGVGSTECDSSAGAVGLRFAAVCTCGVVGCLHAVHSNSKDPSRGVD
jgi:hypothetical protein